jgi:hypothetical protein
MVAKIELAKILQSNEGAINCDKIDVNEDFTEVIVMGREKRG